jgi:hypothetical protein
MVYYTTTQSPYLDKRKIKIHMERVESVASLTPSYIMQHATNQCRFVAAHLPDLLEEQVALSVCCKTKLLTVFP